MNHIDIIKSLITPVKETKVFPKFLHWLLSDPKYGSINQTKDKKSIEAIQGVIDLYEEWLNTGLKPEQKRWLKARDIARDVNATTADAAYIAANAAVAYAANAVANTAVDAGIPRSEVEKAQIDKLNSLIETNGEDDLFTENDYEKD